MSVLEKVISGLIGCVTGVVFTALVGWQFMAIGVNFGVPPCLVLAGVIFVAFFAMIFVHEMGHQFPALAVGIPFNRFTVGPFQLVRDGERIRAKLNTAWYQPAAYVLLDVPQDPWWRWRMGIAIAGGPLSNLVVAALCLGVAHWINPGPPADMPAAAKQGWRLVALTYPGSPLAAGLNITGVLSLGLAISTLLPGSGAGIRTDGGQLLDLLRR